MAKVKKAPPFYKRKRRTVPLAELLGKVAGGTFRRHGFARLEMVSRWPAIVGGLLAKHSMPEQLKFNGHERCMGTLYIRTDSAFATELQHLEPMVIDRINSYCGFPAVARLAIRQAPLPPGRQKRPLKLRPLTSTEKIRLDKMLDGTADTDLRQALESLGKAVLATPQQSSMTAPRLEKEPN